MLDGAKVKAAREELGLTGCAFARLIGVDPSTISKIEGNTFPGIRLAMAIRVAFALRKPLCALLKDASLPHDHLFTRPPSPN